MKKIKYLIITMIVLLIPLCVLAKTNIEGTYIDDIKVPEGYRLYTRENLEEMMTWLNFDATRKLNFKYAWTTNSYYFDVINEEKNTEMILIKKVSDSKIDDLSIYQDEKIIETFKEVEKEYEEFKPKVTLHTTSKGIKYYKIQYTDETSNMFIIDYITNIHGNMYEYKVQSNVELTDENIKIIENIIDSIEYENYLEFVENNKITDEPKKSSNGTIIVIILFVIIIVGGVVAYIFINKKKNDNKKDTNVVTEVYNPVQQNSSNPAVADFMNPTNSNMIEQKNIDLGQSNEENQK